MKGNKKPAFKIEGPKNQFLKYGIKTSGFLK
jgi:hypothetical protein